MGDSAGEWPAVGPVPGTMQAVVQHRYGPADVLRVETRPVPTPGKGEVLLKVGAAGLDRGTWHLMAGEPYLVRLALGLRGPRQPVPGLDVAGTVVVAGAGVTDLVPGDEVYGIATGSFAQYAVARPGKLARRPHGLGPAQAAVVPVSGLTALQAVEVARIHAGQRVLVTGASGGVGSFAVQLAAAAGAEVTGVASAAKHDLVRALGAHATVDYRAGNWADQRYDVVLDLAGGPSLRTLRRALTPGGTAVIVGSEQGGKVGGGLDRGLRGMLWSPFIGRRLVPIVNTVKGSELERLTPKLEDGTLRPPLDCVFPLAEASEAMRRLVAGEVRGKVAIAVDQG